jgi:dipeptidyl aminopeptidase/acylaminoacyl peptidase
LPNLSAGIYKCCWIRLVIHVFTQSVVLTVDGISIVGHIYLPDKSVVHPAVCLCHGVPSGNPPDPDDGGYPALAERICRKDYGVFYFNFRGTGDSGGNFDLLGWTRDLQAVVDYLYSLRNIDSSRLYLVGFSGGAATSVYVASKDRRVSGVAACACPAHFNLLMDRDTPQATIDRYRSIGIIRDDDFPETTESWFDNLKLVQPIDHVAGIAPRSLLLVHGNLDETVPIAHAHELFAKAGEPKQLIVLEAAGHRLRQEEKVVVTILDWLESLRRKA